MFLTFPFIRGKGGGGAEKESFAYPRRGVFFFWKIKFPPSKFIPNLTLIFQFTAGLCEFSISAYLCL